jgi:virginiamycin B lyase
MRRWRQLVFAFVAAAAVLGASPPSGAQTITYVPIPTSNADIAGFALGPDGNVWFTEKFANKIGVITSAGAITEFAIPTSNSFPSGIAAGSDGNLWFFESNPGNIGRITTAGVVTEFPTPHGAGNGFQGAGIAAGSDGALWFTEATAGLIGRITLNGTVSEFTIPTANSSPRAIAAGPDGALWFTESGGNQIGRITTAGAITEFAVPTANSAPRGIAAGSDAALWFTEFSGNKIGRIAQDGMVTEFPVPTANSQPAGITSGPDGALWFAEQNGNNIGRITTDPTLTETQVQAGCTPTALVFDKLYFNCTNGSSPSNNVVGVGPPTQCFTLTTTANPVGGGAISVVAPFDPACGQRDRSLACVFGQECSDGFPAGTVVQVSAIGNNGKSFAGWGGACTGATVPCMVTMTADMSVSASFIPIPTVNLYVNPVGPGTVRGNVGGSIIACGGALGTDIICHYAVQQGSLGDLLATANKDQGASFAGWGGGCVSIAPSCSFTITSDLTVTATFTVPPAPTSPLSALLPTSQVSLPASAAQTAFTTAVSSPASAGGAGFTTATAFATIINPDPTTTATDCAIQPFPLFPGSFVYQTTNPATNALTGTANTPVSIPPGMAQSFVIAITPNVAMPPTPLSFTFACANSGAAPVITDLDTLLFSASATPVPNIIALGATATNDQILHIAGTTGSNAFAVATFNLGSGDTVTAEVDTGDSMLPLALTICQTNPTSGQCLATPNGPTVTATINSNATPTFGVFATAKGTIPFHPQSNRIFARFFDSSGAPRGGTSVAVVAQ